MERKLKNSVYHLESLLHANLATELKAELFQKSSQKLQADLISQSVQNRPR